MLMKDANFKKIEEKVSSTINIEELLTNWTMRHVILLKMFLNLNDFGYVPSYPGYPECQLFATQNVLHRINPMSNLR